MLKLLANNLFGELFFWAAVAFALLCLASITWDATSAALTHLRTRLFGPPPEPPAPITPTNPRRSAASTARHEARAAARRAALHAKHADTADH
ncbi:hypothetical protein [Nocardia sp. AG03]|uniref:hypothetical protein n=1 Tax=Nocardia sp. AG03 TaxID=3025312 RepID=UPI0024186420|nr:hypothetical protein [Nocardia sp. AG03]